MWNFMKKKIKLEFFDKSGAKHSLAIEGELTPEKVNRLLEYAELVAGLAHQQSPTSPHDTKMNRLLDVINTQLSDRKFDSREILQCYQETWGEEFSLGAISTYLSRLIDRGLLERDGSAAHWFYKLKTSPTVSS